MKTKITKSNFDVIREGAKTITKAELARIYGTSYCTIYRVCKAKDFEDYQNTYKESFQKYKVQKKNKSEEPKPTQENEEKFLSDDKFHATELRASQLALAIIAVEQAHNSIAILAYTKHACEQDGIQMDSDEGLLTLSMTARFCGLCSRERTE